MTKVVEITPVESFEGAFEDRGDARKGEPEALVQLRREALARFLENGFPTTKLEEWKKTNLRRLAGTRHALAEVPSQATIDAAKEALQALRLESAAAELVFIDGFHVPALSRIDEQVGVQVQSLAQAVRAGDALPGDVQPGDPETKDAVGTGPEWALSELNLALFTDGLFLQVEKDTVLEAPVHMIHLTTGGHEPVLAVPRHQVVLGRHAQATLLETYAGLDRGAAWTNTVLETRLEEGARLRHYKVQREPVSVDHIGLSAASVGKDATYEDLSFSMGAGLSRHDVHAALVGQGSHVELNGVFLGRFEQHVDNRTTIIHAVPETTSREFYKGIMDDAGHGVFTGKVVVAKGAQHTDSDQQNKNLILSRKGLVDSTPQLEIYADDVKCAHGSAIGQIDPDQLFYMQSRGIPRERSRLILTQVFAHEPLELVPEGPLRDSLAGLVTDWFLSGNPEALAETPAEQMGREARDPLALPGAAGAGKENGKNDERSNRVQK